MKKNYIPGPWDVKFRVNYPSEFAIVANGTSNPKWDLARVYGKANTNLISMAPEMADALEAALPYLKHINSLYVEELVVKIKKIIKEIEGE